jgi:hypothetical protein
MIVLDLETYARLTDDVEMKLDEADLAAAESDVRLSHDEVFSKVRSRLK